MSRRSRQRRALRQASVSGRTRIHLRVFMAEADRHIAAELATARMAGLVTACVRGCHACCYECVAITPAEAVLIVDHVRHTPAAVGLADRARAQLARLAGVRAPTQYRAKRRSYVTQDGARRPDTSGHAPIGHPFMARHILDALGEQP